MRAVYGFSKLIVMKYILLNLGVYLGIIFRKGIQSIIDILIEVKIILLVLNGRAFERSIDDFGLLFESSNMFSGLLNIYYQIIGFHPNVSMLQFF